MMNLNCGGLCNNVCGDSNNENVDHTEDSNNENVDLNHADEEILREALVSMGKKEDNLAKLEKKIKEGKIKINSDGRITHLDLSCDYTISRFEGPIPGINKLTNLTSLNLSHNSLKGPIHGGAQGRC